MYFLIKIKFVEKKLKFMLFESYTRYVVLHAVWPEMTGEKYPQIDKFKFIW